MREALEINKKYDLYGEKGVMSYYITSVVGAGATCIVYDAYYLDEYDLRHMVRIKECFPINGCEKARSDYQIKWNNEEKKRIYISEFEKLYKRHLAMQSRYDFVNGMSKISDSLYSGNNTKYIIMEYENGHSFDKEKDLSLYEKLKTLCALARTVGKYHNIGWLHLDLKPENFMVIPETKELVKLFDFDSIVSMNELKEGKIKSLSYSNGWAAPEVKQGKLRKIGPASDIYSIGAILFYMLFGEKPSIELKLECINNIKNDIDVFKGVNPAIKRKILNFFENTLAASINKRYGNMDEVVLTLEGMIHLADPACAYIKHCLPIQSQFYYGRDNEKEKARRILEKEKMLVISGIGGIGKSEFALNIATDLSSKYDCVIFGKCGKRKLIEFICDKNIFAVSSDNNMSDKQDTYKYVLELISTNMLIVIDDLNDFEDETLSLLLKTGADIIITTRLDADDYFNKKSIIHLDGMETDVLKNIVYHYYERVVDEENDKYLEYIIEKCGNYTILMPIIAKQMKASAYTPKQMWEIMDKKGIGANFCEKVVSNKDGIIRKDYMFNHVKNIFDISNIKNDERQILMALVLLDDLSVEKKTLIRWCSADYNASKELKGTADIQVDLTPINNLIELGWVLYEEKANNVYLHDVIREMFMQELRPDYSNATVFLNNVLAIEEEITDKCSVFNIFDYSPLSIDDDVYTGEHIRWYFKLVYNVFINLDFNDIDNEEYFITLIDNLSNIGGIGSTLAWGASIFALSSHVLNGEKGEITDNYKLKLQEWNWNYCMENISENKEGILVSLRNAINIGQEIKDWSKVTVYSDIKEYYRNFYWFIYKFDKDEHQIYGDFVKEFKSIPDLKEVINLLREIIIISLDGEDRERFLEIGKEYLKQLDALEHEIEQLDSLDESGKEEVKELDETEGVDLSEDAMSNIFLKVIVQLEDIVRQEDDYSIRMKMHLTFLIKRLRDAFGSNDEIGKLLPLKEIRPELYLLMEDSWTQLRDIIYNDKFDFNEMYTTIWEMCEMKELLNDISPYVNFSEVIASILEVGAEMNLNTDFVLGSFKEVADELDKRNLNVCLLLKEMQKYCIKDEVFMESSRYWDEFISLLLQNGFVRAFIKYIDGYSERIKDSIGLELTSMVKDTSLVTRLSYKGYELLALKVQLDIIKTIEELETDENKSKDLGLHYKKALRLSMITDNEEIYYVIREKMRTRSNINFYFNKPPKFSDDNVNKIQILESYIRDINCAETYDSRHSIYNKLMNEKYLDEVTKELLIMATEEKETVISVALNDMEIDTGFIASEELLRTLIKSYAENDEEDIYVKIQIVGDICLQSLLLNLDDDLNKYVDEYIALIEKLFDEKIDALDFMLVTTLPTILYINDADESAYKIYEAVDKIIEKYNIDNCTSNEKMLILPYLARMYDILKNMEDINKWAVKREIYIKMYDLLTE